MDGKETIAILTMIKVAYPNAYNDITAEERQCLYKLWQQAFQEIPYSLLNQAVSQHIATSKFPPTIADINDLLDRIEQQAYNALKDHYRQLKENEEAERYGETAYQVGELLTDEQLQEVNDILRAISNRDLRINEPAWKKSQKKLGGKQ